MSAAMDRLKAAHAEQRRGRPAAVAAAAPAPSAVAAARREPPVTAAGPARPLAPAAPAVPPVEPRPEEAPPPDDLPTGTSHADTPPADDLPSAEAVPAPDPAAHLRGVRSGDPRVDGAALGQRLARLPAMRSGMPLATPPTHEAPPHGAPAGDAAVGEARPDVTTRGRPVAVEGPPPRPAAPPPPPRGDRIGRGARLAARRLLLVLLVLSLIGGARSLAHIAATPGLGPFVDAGQEQIRAAMDREMARSATPERVLGRLDALLSAPERNWVAIDAVMGVAEERGVFLPAEMLARIDAAQSADEGLWATAAGCLACLANPAACQLSAQLLCQAPMVLTPAGDIAAVGTEAVSWARGGDVDRVNLALGLAGLGATAAIVATGGTSLPIKIGAGALRTARSMGLVSARLGAMLARAADEGIDWGRMRGLGIARALDGETLPGLVRPAALAPLRATAVALGRIEAATGPRAALHLLSRIDDATEARRIANAAEVLGPRTVGRIEVLGKGRFLRATVRLTDLALQTIASLVGLILAAGGLASSACSHATLRLLRRRLARA
ncbi:hypothetical protein [Frigidibacter sp. MR17.24]|uniref:hypothetical protein n=1 Tax=Frigidibacter sp. MR17.24 TaxID=3127345 RepID=UPI003012D29E